MLERELGLLRAINDGRAASAGGGFGNAVHGEEGEEEEEEEGRRERVVQVETGDNNTSGSNEGLLEDAPYTTGHSHRTKELGGALLGEVGGITGITAAAVAGGIGGGDFSDSRQKKGSRWGSRPPPQGLLELGGQQHNPSPLLRRDRSRSMERGVDYDNLDHRFTAVGPGGSGSSTHFDSSSSSSSKPAAEYFYTSYPFPLLQLPANNNPLLSNVEHHHGVFDARPSSFRQSAPPLLSTPGQIQQSTAHLVHPTLQVVRGGDMGLLPLRGKSSMGENLSGAMGGWR